MKKGLLAIPVGGVVAALVAIGATSIKPWSWDESTRNKTINYCLLIGQTDHNDSAARTGGIRDALGTRPAHETGSNANTETAKQGKLKVTYKSETGKQPETYTVNELESKTCVSDTGATWDQGTAVITCNNWYSKYKDNLTMVVSNNDGMAEGASFALNCPKGMPIFGYDSNKSTLNLIEDGQITGTINSNAPAQAAAMNIMACRILDGTYDADSLEAKTNPNYIYQTLFKGFKCFNEKGQRVGWDAATEDESKVKGGGEYVVNDGYITDILGNPIEFKYNKEDHSLLVSSKEIYSKEDAKKFNIAEAEQFAKINTGDPKTGREKAKYSFFQSCYSKTDTYLTTTMNPLLIEARKKFNIDNADLKDMVYGNGNDEVEITNKLQSMNAQDAYLINMTKTVNADQYVSSKDDKGNDVQGEIEKKIGNKEKYKKTPIIFYNRQPSDDNGVNTKCMNPETNGGNKYTFYVGFDAQSGATLQGTMIQKWLADKLNAESVIPE